MIILLANDNITNKDNISNNYININDNIAWLVGLRTRQLRPLQEGTSQKRDMLVMTLNCVWW